MAKKCYIELFGSVTEYVTKINARKRVKDAYKCSEKHDNNGRWTGTSTYEEANSLALEGDVNSAALIGDATIKLKVKTKQNPIQQTKIRRSIVGSRPCVAAAIVGHPLAMYHRDKVRVNKPIVNFVYTMGASASVPREIMAETGAKVALAIRNAERSGVKINLYIGDASFDCDEYVGAYVKIKNSEKDFNVLRMAYPLANPAFLRRHWFRWLEGCDEITWAEWGSGYGRPIDRHADALAYFNEQLKRVLHYDVHLTYKDAQNMSVEDLTKVIMGGR